MPNWVEQNLHVVGSKPDVDAFITAGYLRRTRDQFDTLYAEGATRPRCMALAVHPYITGVPHRIKYFDHIFQYLTRQPGVLFWTGEEILDWYLAQTQP